MPGDAQPFGKYDLVERIAAGGMAEIYRAKYRAAAGITKQVVIKKILPHYAGNKSFIRMFMDEAKIVVSLSHGNIAQVFDFGEIDGEFFLAMEFVQGQPLSKLMRRAREKQIPVIPTPFAVFLAMEMCKGLHYAHTRLGEDGRPLNIVHRDVSPQNVIISYDGQVKLVDFGIAKARTAGRNETEAGAIKGKYVYFSPEQARGRDIDARTDVFATGTVLYEMLCGRLPFEGKMIEVLSKVVKCEFPRPRLVNPDITPALERILLTAMAADKADRYPTAQALQEALAGYLYANAPTFSGASLAQLVAYLYEPELVAMGTPTQLPRDFLEQVPLWRKALPAGTTAGSASQERERETTADRASRRIKRAPEPETRAGESVAGVGKSTNTKDGFQEQNPFAGKTKWLLFAVPLAAAGLAAALVFAVGNFGTFSVQLTSSPPGAAVLLDGKPAGEKTPLLISGLAASSAHEIRITAPGMKPWVKSVEPARGTTVPVHAELEPERPPPDLTPPPEPKVEVAKVETPKEPPKERVRFSADYPVASVEVFAKDHAFAVPPTNAARIRLDPAKTYEVWGEGELSLGGYLDVLHAKEAFFFVEGGGESPPDETFGELGQGRRAARTIRNASALYAFLFDDRPGDNSGAMKIRIQQKGSKNVSTLLLDAKLNAVWPEDVHRFTLNGLDKTATYEVMVKAGDVPARSDGRARKGPPKVAYVQNSGYLYLQQKPIDVYAQVLEAGRTYKMTGASMMAFTFPDDALEDNEGSVVVEVSPVVGSGGTFGISNLGR